MIDKPVGLPDNAFFHPPPSRFLAKLTIFWEKNETQIAPVQLPLPGHGIAFGIFANVSQGTKFTRL